MAYQLLSQDEQDEIIVSFFESQEREEFCHSINKERYDNIIATVPDSEWRSNVIKLRNETEQRLADVKSIIAASVPQLPSTERIAAAKSRLLTKQALK